MGNLLLNHRGRQHRRSDGPPLGRSRRLTATLNAVALAQAAGS